MAAIAAAALVALAGCADAPSPNARPQTTRPVETATVDLEVVREAAGIADCPVVPAEATPVEGGLPDLTLPCLGSARTVNLAALRGQPMVLNFWAQWCPPCRAEAPHLRAFAEASGDRVLVLGIDYDDPDPALALEFAGLVGWSYPHLVDADRAAQRPLNLVGIPVTLFVDASGAIVYRHAGGFESAEQLSALASEHLGVQA